METVRLAKEATETVLLEDPELMLPKHKQMAKSVRKLFFEHSYVSQL